MANYPDFVYETVGTAMFTLISSAAIATASGFTAALYFALVWALCHTTFKDRCQAYFNPVLSLGHHVAKGGDLAGLFATIVAQFLGSFVGIYLMGALEISANIPAYEHADNAFQTLIYELLFTALFVKLFLTAAPKDVCDRFWQILVIATLVFVAGNRMFVARYAADAFAADDFPNNNNVMVILGSVAGSIVGAVVHNFASE